MENAQALKLAGIYLGLWLAATVVGLAVVAVGVALGGLGAVGLYAWTPLPLRLVRLPIPGFVVALLGIVLWKFGTAAASAKVLGAAVDVQLSGQLDTESMKSDILSVLDDRLADMHQDISETRRLVNRQSRDDAASDFEFQEDLGND